MNELKNIYYNPRNPAGFSSIKKLYNEVKKTNPEIRYDDVKDWLSGELTYTLHKDAKRNYPREKIFVTQPLEQYQADLVDMQKVSRVNKGFKYILTVIDCFSRYAFAEPVKNKNGNEIKRAFEKIFQNNKPFKLQTDRGKEFMNNVLQNYLKENNIIYFTTFNTQFKCAIVERFNRTLKEKMHKYFTSKGTTKYIDILQDLVDSYNNSIHRTINTTPSNVNFSNKDIIFQNIYGYPTPKEYLFSTQRKNKLKVGDTVRRKYLLNSFDKGYLPKWTDEIYKIEKTISGVQRPMYRINNTKEKLYSEEVQKVKENLYRIEKIIKREEQQGVKGFIVKWLNYPSKYNSWVPEKDVIDLNK